MESSKEGKLTPEFVKEHIQRVNLSIPGQEPEYTMIEIEDIISSHALRISNTPFEIKKEVNHETRSVWGMAIYQDDMRMPSNAPPLIATCGGDTILVYSSFDLRQVYKDEPTEDFYCLAFGMQEKRPILAAAGKTGVISVLDLSVGQQLCKLYGHKNEINALKCMVRTHNLLLSCSNDYTIRLWNYSSRVQIAIFHGTSGHNTAISAIDLHQSEQLFLSGALDGSIKLWQLGQVKRGIEKSHSWNADFIEAQGLPCARNPFDTKVIHNAVFSTRKVHKTYVECARFIQNIVVSMSHEGMIVIWQAQPEWKDDSVIILFTISHLLETEMKIHFRLNTAQRVVVVGGTNNKIYIYSLITGECFKTLKVGNSNDPCVRHVGFYNNFLVGVNDHCNLFRCNIKYN